MGMGTRKRERGRRSEFEILGGSKGIRSMYLKFVVVCRGGGGSLTGEFGAKKIDPPYVFKIFVAR